MASVILLVAASISLAQEGEIIHSVKVTGNKRVDESTILYHIQSKPGTVLSKKQVREDIEQIYSLRQFKDIRVETRNTAAGLEVEFHVEEIPSIGDVEIVGNDKVDASDIREIIGLTRGANFNEHLVHESSEEILRLYREKGYFFAEADIDTQPKQENLVDITINIKEGEKVKIEEIRFSGNKEIRDKDLLRQMETKEESWYSFLDDSGVYQKDVLKLDLFRIEGYYHDQGYLRVKVLEPRIDINQKSREIHITIAIEEGPQFRIKTVEIQGDDSFSANEIQRNIRTKVGAIYNVSRLRQDILIITGLYSQKGYAYAEANPVSKLNDEDHTVGLSIEIDKGKRVYVGRIDILGNIKTRDNVIRREFRLREGEVFDGIKLKRSKQRLNNLNYFDDVKIDTGRGQEPDLIDILATVTERPTGSFTAGFGFSSTENFIFSTSITQNNLFGHGRRLSLSAHLSSSRTDFKMSFTERSLFDSDISVGVDVFNDNQDYINFDAKSKGGGFHVGKRLSEYDSIGINYRLAKVEEEYTDPADPRNEDYLTSKITPIYTYDSRDNFLNPSTGWKHVVGLDFAGLGGRKFTKYSYDVTYYHPIVGKLVGVVHTRINHADGYGGDLLPSSERFFMGGPNSLRGFNIEDVGPQDCKPAECPSNDPDPDPVGGNQSLLFNLELQYPLTKAFRAALFYDRGNVYGGRKDRVTGEDDLTNTADSFDLGKMRSSVGAGIRFISPVGPLGFAYGFKLDQQEGESAGEFHFSAGSVF